MKKTNLTDKQKKKLEEKVYKKMLKQINKGTMSNKKFDRKLKKLTKRFEPTIKAKIMEVVSVDISTKTVVVRQPFDTSTITLPYNPQIEDYLTDGTTQGKLVSVWYNQSFDRGIAMQSGDWNL